MEEKGIGELYMGISHNLFSKKAYRRIMEMRKKYSLRKLDVTNSIPQTEDFKQLPFFTEYDLAVIFANEIGGSGRYFPERDQR
ncbi:MAG: hypothetical protein JW881_09385 [Spirochaetales bacterium]|nr:hypothetical protein [Spirochaetales bacterium]